MLFQAEKWGEFFGGEFIDANGDVVGEHELEEDALLAVELGVDLDLGFGAALRAGIGCAPEGAEFGLVVENSGSWPKSSSTNCCDDMAVTSGAQKLVSIMCRMVRALPSARLILILSRGDGVETGPGPGLGGCGPGPRGG